MNRRKLVRRPESFQIGGVPSLSLNLGNSSFLKKQSGFGTGTSGFGGVGGGAAAGTSQNMPTNFRMNNMNSFTSNPKNFQLNLDTSFKLNNNSQFGGNQNSTGWLGQENDSKVAGGNRDRSNKNMGAGISSAANFIGGASGIVGTLGESLIGPEKVSTDHYGVNRADPKNIEKKSSVAGVKTGMDIGGQVGGIFGPVGKIAGTALGAFAGWAFGKKAGIRKGREAVAKYGNETMYAENAFNRDKYASGYAMAKGGIKLSIQRKFKSFDKKKKIIPIFKVGGVMDANIIPSGNLHRENNKIDGKDKGIPVVGKDGTKLFEIEKEEFILNLDSTQLLESLVDKYNAKEDSNLLVDIGKMMYFELLGNTKDNTQQFIENEA